MKIAILTNSRKNGPHIQIYVDLLRKLGVEPDIIYWDSDAPAEEFNFPMKRDYNGSSLSRFLPYVKYAGFLKRVVKRHQYDKLIVNSPAVGLFIPFFLKRKYKGKYIFDYRDLSIEQIPLLRPFMKMVLKNAYANVLSSPAFSNYLPQGFEFVISHNFNIDLARKALGSRIEKPQDNILKILTIGSIRKDANFEVLDSVGNAPGIELAFVGKSGNGSAELLEAHSKEKGYKNILFKGLYRKEEEGDIYKQFNFVNIFYPRIPSHITALSNRFYNSLIYRRPMIVTKGGIQGNLVEEYGVGLAIDNCEDLPQKLKYYYDNLDFEAYQERCDNLLKVIIKDYEIFAECVKSFLLHK